MGRKATVKCENCTKDFEALLIKMRRGNVRFCSKDCYFEHRKKNKKDPKYLNRLYQKKHKYGLTEEQYLGLYKKQNNKCGICEEDFDKKGKSCVDHSHKNGNVRGILCDDCNRGIGMFKDDIKILKKAIEYLEKTK